MRENYKYIRRLERKAKENCAYVYYITISPDPKHGRNTLSMDKKFRGHNFYLYTERPEIRYSIVEFRRNNSNSHKLFKKIETKKYRQKYKHDTKMRMEELYIEEKLNEID